MKKLYFEGAYPSPNQIRRMTTAERELRNYIFPEKLVLAVRREAFSFDVLVQPDIRRILRQCAQVDLKPVLNRSRKKAEEIAESYRAQIADFVARLGEFAENEALSAFETDILWGRYQLVMQSEVQWALPLSPYYFHVDRRRFQKQS